MHHRFNAAVDLHLRLSTQAVRRWGQFPSGIVSENQTMMQEGQVQLQGHDERTSLSPAPPTVAIRCAPEPVPLAQCRFSETEICVANVDTLTAALVLGDACALNFANAYTPGGGYLHGARAQEEDLCRLLPQLHPALLSASEHYPIEPDVALLTRGLEAVRKPGSYELCSSLGECAMVTSAMPQIRGSHQDADSPEWRKTVTFRIRAVLHAAQVSGRQNLVLGAWGCGAFGNPPEAVAALFRDQLSSPEFRGSFATVVFAIIDPRGDGNLEPFEKVMRELYEVSDGA